MKEDTDNKFMDIAHFFANSYNQMLTILTGFPDSDKLAEVMLE